MGGETDNLALFIFDKPEFRASDLLDEVRFGLGKEGESTG